MLPVTLPDVGLGDVHSPLRGDASQGIEPGFVALVAIRSEMMKVVVYLRFLGESLLMFKVRVAAQRASRTGIESQLDSILE